MNIPKNFPRKSLNWKLNWIMNIIYSFFLNSERGLNHFQYFFIMLVSKNNLNLNLTSNWSFVQNAKVKSKYLIQTEEKTNGENGNVVFTSSSDKTSIIFTLKHQVGALARALQVFQELGINVLHIELHSEKETETVSTRWY
jgi:hypothetical protein